MVLFEPHRSLTMTIRSSYEHSHGHGVASQKRRLTGMNKPELSISVRPLDLDVQQRLNGKYLESRKIDPIAIEPEFNYYLPSTDVFTKRALLDTGASCSLMSTSLAAKLVGQEFVDRIWANNSLVTSIQTVSHVKIEARMFWADVQFGGTSWRFRLPFDLIEHQQDKLIISWRSLRKLCTVALDETHLALVEISDSQAKPWWILAKMFWS